MVTFLIVRNIRMNFKNKKVAFFDMDGTLVDSETLYYQTRKEVLAKYGYEYSKAENNPILATGFAKTLSMLQKKVADPELGKQIFDESIALYDERVKEGKLAVKTGAEKLLAFLNQQGIKSYITSSSDLAKINFNLSHNDLRPYFAGLITGEDVQHNKPAPDIYLHALKVAGAKKEEAVIFEDAPNGVESGLNANIDVVMVPDQLLPPSELRKQVIVVDSLDQAIPFFK